MTYRTIIWKAAESQIRRQYTYLLKHAPEYADVWVDRLDAAIESLTEMPERCPIAPEEKQLKEGIRHLLFDSSRILFTVKGRDVNIIHVRHMRRRPLPGKRGRDTR